jgi:hypothetical protein
VLLRFLSLVTDMISHKRQGQRNKGKAKGKDKGKKTSVSPTRAMGVSKLYPFLGASVCQATVEPTDSLTLIDCAGA